MAIDRRRAVRLLAAGLASPFWPKVAGAVRKERRYLAAGATGPDRYRVAGFTGSGETLLDRSLPARGHAFAVHPDGLLAVHFARRPGTFALALDTGRGVVRHSFEPPRDRRFQGHGVFDPAGRLLYATENDFDAGRGVVGIYDARNGFRRLGDISSHGTGPHDIRLLRDGRTLVVANGGIHTHPDYPRVKLNLPEMQPSLCLIDRGTGRLRRKLRLNADLHQLSIRHLAVGMGGQVAVAMQYEGPGGDRVPLVALCRSDGPLRLLDTPPTVLRAMRQYCGDVCFDPTGRHFAVSAPRGSLVTVWDGADGSFLHAARLADCCGLAPGTRAGEFLVSSGQGGMFLLDPCTRELRPFPTGFSRTRRWDNHLAVAGADVADPRYGPARSSGTRRRERSG